MALERIQKISTGVGKRRVEQVVLTHNHYDHAGLLPQIHELYHPTVYAFSRSVNEADIFLRDGDTLKIGDRVFEVIHTPGHSHDSICLYCEQEAVLFAGDTSLVIHSSGGTYESGFVHALERLREKTIHTIYFGHGHPVYGDVGVMINRTLKIIKQRPGSVSIKSFHAFSRMEPAFGGIE
jgi:glyoxylase-like metal-dependent hydrolase (beta-lactamase superfamily II)